MLKYLAAAVVLAVASQALAANQSGEAITGYFVGGGAGNPVDARPCVFFQTGGGNQWHSVAQSDGNYAEERDFLKAALIGRWPIWFTLGTQQCGGFPVVSQLSTYAQ